MVDNAGLGAAFLVGGGTLVWAGSTSINNALHISDLTAIASDLAGNYKLMVDLTLNNWTPLGNSATPFTGTFDGNGKTLTVTGTVTPNNNRSGIFGQIGTGGTVKNLKVANTIDNGLSNSGDQYGGAIAGYNRGTIENCVATANVSIATTSLSVTVGGIAGYNAGIIKNCYSTGIVDVPAVGNTSYAGGIVGNNTGGTIFTCYAAGNVTALSNGGGTAAYAAGIANNFTGGILTGNVALNGTITAGGANTKYLGRISGGTGGTWNGNYANSAMTLTPTQTIANNANDKNGANVTLAATQVQRWWSSTPGFVFGSSAWKWHVTDLRPVLWFE